MLLHSHMLYCVIVVSNNYNIIILISNLLNLIIPVTGFLLFLGLEICFPIYLSYCSLILNALSHYLLCCEGKTECI